MNKFLIAIVLVLAYASVSSAVSFSDVRSMCQGYKNQNENNNYICYWGVDSHLHGYKTDIQRQSESSPAVYKMTKKNSQPSKYQLKHLNLKGNIELCSGIEDMSKKMKCIDDKTDEAFPDYYVTIISAKANTLQIVVNDIDESNTIFVSNFDGYDYYAFLQ